MVTVRRRPSECHRTTDLSKRGACVKLSETPVDNSIENEVENALTLEMSRARRIPPWASYVVVGLCVLVSAALFIGFFEHWPITGTSLGIDTIFFELDEWN